jgi:hypothetical protein
MDKVIELSRNEIRELLAQLGIDKLPPHVYGLRVCSDGEWVKFKVNQQGWTHGLGHLDPDCRVAARQRTDRRTAENEFQAWQATK